MLLGGADLNAFTSLTGTVSNSAFIGGAGVPTARGKPFQAIGVNDCM